MTGFISQALAQETPAAPAAAEPQAAPAQGEAAHATQEGSTVAHEGGEHGGFPPFNPATFPSQLVWLAIAFVVLYQLMRKRIVPQIGGILAARAERIAADVAEAEKAHAETDAAIAAYEKALADARSKAAKLAFDTRSRVHHDVDVKRHAAEADLSGKLSAAEQHIADIKAKALSEVSAIATDTAAEVVEALVGSSSRDEAAAAVASIRKS